MAGRYSLYSSRKNSGVEWLGSVPEHWQTKPLKHFAQFINGNAFKPSEWSENGIPIIRIENLNGGEKFNYYEGKVHDRYRVEKGDLLFGWSGNKGTSFGPFIWWQSGQHYLNQHIFRLEGFECHKRWFYWVLKAATYYIEEQAQGIIGMIHVTKSKLGGIPIPAISKHEQRTIAAFLDHETARIDQLIAKQQRLIELLKEKRQAVISHAVTKGLPSITGRDAPMKDSGVEWLGEVPEHWRVTQLRHLIKYIEQGKSPECEARLAEGIEWGVLKTGCVNGGVYRATEHKALPSYITPHSEYEVKTGDLLMSRASGSRDLIGAVAYVDDTPPRLLLSDKVFRLILESGVHSEYLALLMSSKHVRSQVELAINGAEGLANNITKESIKSFVVAMPDYDEQVAIFRHISTQSEIFAELAARLSEALMLLQERRTALISAAVTGKIDVRNWTPNAQAPEQDQLMAAEPTAEYRV